MARIEPILPGAWPPEMLEALAAMSPPSPRHPRPAREGRPAGHNILGSFAHHPALARAFFTFNGHVLFATTLSERRRELLVLRVAALRGCEYEWAQHAIMARDSGLTDEEIARVGSGPDAPEWTELDSALVRAVDELIADGAIGDATWAALSAELDDSQLLDVVFTVGAYETVAWMMRSLDLELDDDVRSLASDYPRMPGLTDGA